MANPTGDNVTISSLVPLILKQSGVPTTASAAENTTSSTNSSLSTVNPDNQNVTEDVSLTEIGTNQYYILMTIVLNNTQINTKFLKLST